MFARPRAVGWLVSVALVGGCGGQVVQDGAQGGAPGVVPTDPDAEEALAIEEFAVQVTRAACEREVRCVTYLNAANCEADGFPSGMLTLPVLDPMQAFSLRYHYGLDLYLDLAREYALGDRATQEACLTEIRDGSCNLADFRPETCQSALAAEAPRMGGESCEAPSFYLPPRPCLGLCECGSCRPVEANAGEEGGPCGPSGQCSPGLECDYDVDTCQAWPGLGEPCQGRCAEGSCRDGTCERRGVVGEPCEAYSECALDAECVAGSCSEGQAGPLDSPCAWDSESSCYPGYCVFDQPDATTGICAIPSLDIPGPCNGNGATPSCPAGSYPSSLDAALGACECLSALQPGEVCDDSGSATVPCGGSRCYGGICTELPGPGEPCNAELGCDSNLVCVGERCLALCVK